MKRFASVFLVVLSLARMASADSEPDASSKSRSLVFTLHYAVVSNKLKYGEGCFDKLIDNVWVGDFWYRYAIRTCTADTEKALERELKVKNNPTQKEIEDLSNKLVGDCLQPFIFDNWDKINLTITKNPSKDCVKKAEASKTKK